MHSFLYNKKIHLSVFLTEKVSVEFYRNTIYRKRTYIGPWPRAVGTPSCFQTNSGQRWRFKLSITHEAVVNCGTRYCINDLATPSFRHQDYIIALNLDYAKRMFQTHCVHILGFVISLEHLDTILPQIQAFSNHEQTTCMLFPCVVDTGRCASFMWVSLWRYAFWFWPWY
jgi:hypothetical protein